MAVSDQVLATKLLAPRTGTRLINRSRLMELFEDHQDRKLTLVTAPAGFGKSVLLSQFTGQLESPVVWYHLDPFDNDLAVFTQYLVTGIARHRPGFGTDILHLTGRGGSDSSSLLRRIVTALINDLSDAFAGEDLVMVLDDYHVIREPVIHSFVQEILEYLPPRVHVIIAGRTVPPLPLTKLKVSEMVLEIGQDKLQFNRTEIAAYLVAEYNQPVLDQVIAAVEAETRGWPAAMRLAIPAPGEPEARPGGSADGVLRRRKEIYYYLASEVLHNLPDEVESFLLATSVLDILTPSICDRFLGRTGSLEMLETLEKENLFIVALEGVDYSYRYHHLFRDFLQSRLGAEKNTLLRKAGLCYLETGTTRLAVEYFLQAGDFGQALGVIEKVGAGILRRGRWKTLERWLHSLPEGLRREKPWVLLLQGALDIMHGRLGEAEPLIERAQQAFDAEGNSEGLLQSQLHRARIFRSRGDYKASLKLLEAVLPGLTRRPVADWYDVCLEHAFGLTLQGKLDRAARLLKDALAAAEREGESRIAAHLAEKLGELYYFKGEYSRAVEVHQRAVEMASDPERMTYSIRDNIAIIYRDWGDLDNALEYALKSIETKESLGMVEALPYAYHQLAIIQADLGQIEEAEQNFRKAISLARETGGEAFFLTLSMALYGRLLGVLERLDEARALVDQAIAIAWSQSEFIYGICLEVAAPIYEQTGEKEEALRMLHQALGILERIGAKFSLCIACGALTWINSTRGDSTEARRYAARCLELAAAESYLQMFSTYREMLLPVVRFSLEEGREPAFTGLIVKRLGSRIAGMLVELSGHDDPAVRSRVVQPLARIGDEAAAKIVIALMQDPDETVRDCALAAAQQYLKKAAPAAAPRATRPVVSTSSMGERAALQISCLGPFRAAVGEKVLSWRTSKARDLFAFLIHHGQKAVSKERILEELWPETDPEHSTTLLHTNLYQLRRAVKQALRGYNVVRHSAGHYTLDLSLLSCDHTRFAELVQSNNGGDREAERAGLEESLALYRGEYLEGLDYGWIDAERERLSQLYLSALDRLSTLYSDAGEYARAASCLRAVLQVNPLLEEVHARLMSVYARQGDRMAVIQQYETLTRVLEDELGIDPGASTRELYYKLCGDKE